MTTLAFKSLFMYVVLKATSQDMQLTEKILGPLPSSSPPVPCPFLVVSAPS